jgi:hypothetical protein
METVQKVLEIPRDTLNAMERLAQITGAKSGSAELIQDALRLFQWVVYQQTNGREVLALPRDMADKAPDNIEMLGHLIDDDKMDQAVQFFKAA